MQVRNVNRIILGKYEMEAWYFSPMPFDHMTRTKGADHIDCVIFCEFCLSYFAHDDELRRHMRKCTLRHPPGNEIYRSVEQNIHVAVFEVDGRKEKLYCQNLCYISKMFLDHKNLWYVCLGIYFVFFAI